MKMKGFRGDTLIAWSGCRVRQNSGKRKFGFSSNSLRSGPPFEWSGPETWVRSCEETR